MRNRRLRRGNGSLTNRRFQLENLEDRRLMAGVTAASNLDTLMPPPAPEGEPQMIVQDSGGGNADFSFNERLAYRWAPIHRQDVAQSSGDGLDGKADYISTINFDGDWDTRNNWENAATFQDSMEAHGYYSVSETSTHWHIVYGFFHARDWATGIGANLDTHENDMEGLVSVVRKPSDPAGNPYGQLQAMTTVSHNDFYTFTDVASGFVNGEQGIDGTIQYRSHDGEMHPITEQEAKGHGLKAWTGNDFNSFPGNDGVVYYPSLTTAEVPSSQNDRFVRYKLVDIFEEGGLYDRRGQSETFVSDGLFHQTNGGGGNAKAPWKWDDGGTPPFTFGDGPRLTGGELATDPARLTSIYLDNLGVWRETYLTNQYRGIEPAAPGIDYVQPTVRSYIPPGIAGDDEFGGNGPQIVSTASLRVRPNGEGLDTQLFMQAAEVGGDSIAAGTQAWSQQWFAPSHQGVASFYGSNSGSVVYVDDDHDMDDFLFSQDGSLFDRNGIVQRMSFVGDTSGDDIGETRVDAYFNRVEVSLYTELGDTEDGLATQDGATGQGYAMYSQENVFNRFAANPPYDDTLGRNSENIIAVKYFNDQWHYDNNSTYVPFTPEPSDILIASLDFDADQIMSLEGVDEIENGIVKGFEGGNLTFEADQFGGVFNNGEFTITGSQLFPNRELVDVGAINDGIAATDTAVGNGFILYSEENLFTRFSESQPYAVTFGGTVFNANSDHMVAVINSGGNWFYDDNSNYVPFTPRPSDVLLASVDFTNNEISSLEGTDDIVDGIAAGYAVGDLTFEADVLNGAANNDEFTVSGTTFVRNHELSSLGQTNDGVAVAENATGEGYIMFSEKPVSQRFSPAPLGGSSDRLIAVRYDNGWQYNDNGGWRNFTPVASDVLVAQVDFSNDTITGLEGAKGDVEGIARGYDVGDLTFEANKYAGLSNTGEFTVRGTQFFRGVGELGDFDFDGDFDLNDADALSQAIAGGSSDLAFDTNADGQVTSADMVDWVTNIKGTLMGDANLDFTVDGLDFIAWNNNKFQSTGRWSQADFNADGVTDGADFVVWNNNKFQNVDSSSLRGDEDNDEREERRVNLVDDLFAALA